MVQFDPRHKRNRNGIIIVLSGPSGAGKNTLINQVKHLDLGVHYIPSFTTRAQRPGESQGNPYYFVDLRAFQEMVDRQEFLEYEQIHGNYYGTHAKTYEYAIEHGYDAIKDIDVKGAMNFKRRFPGHVVLVYVRPSSLDALTGRLVTRGDSQEDIRVRMSRLNFEESKRPEFDYVVYNDDLETAKNQLVDIIRRVTGTG
ncbi:MAG: guanylate kinase [Alicyclobacillus sp.]|nr:guanylate kinase [Alicyclobacillus sp.]